MKKQEKDQLKTRGFSKDYIAGLIPVKYPDGHKTFLHLANLRDNSAVTVQYDENRCYECNKRLTNSTRYWVHIVIPKIFSPCNICNHVRFVHYQHMEYGFVCEIHKPQKDYSTIISSHRVQGICCSKKDMSPQSNKEWFDIVDYFDKQSIRPMEGAF